MIGLILTGHGEFAIGVGHALEMIAGKQTAYKVVPFLESDPIETLENNLRDAMKELQEETEGIVVFADLLGGSPFKSAMVASMDFDNVEVVVGTNLPMLIEAYASRFTMTTAHEIAKAITATAIDGVKVRPEELQPEAAAPVVAQDCTSRNYP